MELISMIVPVYKVEKYLDRCLESLVNQSYPNLEIILVDDGSPDRCGEMCDDWAARDCRIRVIHKENGGLSDARNAGLAVATGEVIGFVDSDDWLDTDFVYHLYQALEKTGAGIAACDCRFVTEDETVATVGQRTPPYRICTGEAAVADILSGVGFRATAWNKLYRRQYLEGEQYPVGRHHEDEFFTYRILAKAEKLVYVDLPLYCYVQRGGSIMHSLSMKRLDALDAGLERIAFLRKRYPGLVLRGKVALCFSCLDLYRQGLRMEGPERKRFLREIRKARSQVRFSPEELCGLTAKDRVYMMGSGMGLDTFCRVLNFRHRKEPNG